MNKTLFLNEADLEALGEQFANLANESSAVIKIIILEECDDLDHKVIELFKQYNLDKIDARNSVMFVIVLKTRELFILGDVGITQKVGEEYWEFLQDLIITEFKNGKFGNGILKGVDQLGVQLIKFFPGKQESNIKSELIF